MYQPDAIKPPLQRLWGLSFFVFALLLALPPSLYVAPLLEPPAPVEPASTGAGFWGVIILFCMIGAVYYYFWRPIVMLSRAIPDAGDLWRLIGLTAWNALPWALMAMPPAVLVSLDLPRIWSFATVGLAVLVWQVITQKHSIDTVLERSGLRFQGGTNA